MDPYVIFHLHHARGTIMAPPAPHHRLRPRLAQTLDLPMQATSHLDFSFPDAARSHRGCHTTSRRASEPSSLSSRGPLAPSPLHPPWSSSPPPQSPQSDSGHFPISTFNSIARTHRSHQATSWHPSVAALVIPPRPWLCALLSVHQALQGCLSPPMRRTQRRRGVH